MFRRVPASCARMDRSIQQLHERSISTQMKNIVRFKNLPLITLTFALGFLSSSALAQHINAGAFSTNHGAQLYFVNGASFVNTSGFVRTMNYSNSGTYAKLYNVSNPSFTALAQTTNNGATPSPSAAAFGSFLQLRLETVVSGPESTLR